MSSGFNTVGNTFDRLNNGFNQFTSDFVPLPNESVKLQQTITDFQNNHPELAKDATFQHFVQKAQSINGGLDKFNSGLTDFSQNLSKTTAGSKKLIEGTNSITTKLEELSTGASKLADAQQQLANGANNVNKGWSKVISSLISIKSGEDKLKMGSKKLTNQLKNGAKQIQSIHAGQPIYEMMSNPVRLKEQLVHSVPNYGTGLAPYFLSLSLFVGALLLSTIFPIRETNKRAPSGMAWFLSKFIFLSAISIFHSVITNLILIYVIGLDPANKAYLYLFAFVTSLTFMSIILFLVTTANNAGRFLAIILLVLQLTSSAGTFPIELTPGFLQRIHSLMPMTYTVQGFRSIISTADYHLLRQDVLVLIVYLILSMLLTLLVMRHLLKKQTSSG
ncbi:YhgE/Pip family protein [Neobacillus sp. PS3-34]|uniref:YhgE/Pip family protein n=1 Tax=Neobacillus sp. PS3-34 TaxID=3070678 RepID=UPI0027E1A2D9|nr:YhgE/Pip family protein [Neobacillus sp. PS3-34]WML48959.1 YhgE/Pip family protein [Neobacillus sp. PS3-34]